MRVTTEQLVNGIIRFADEEVIKSLPTTGKWIIGASVGIVSAKINDVVCQLNENTMARTMGIIDNDGLIDTDLLMDNLRDSASRYGNVTVHVPLVGELTFSDGDIATLKDYVERG